MSFGFALFGREYAAITIIFFMIFLVLKEILRSNNKTNQLKSPYFKVINIILIILFINFMVIIIFNVQQIL